jgi:translation initiation factor 2 beta subunit (eIF-2beta)/eIF-5
MYQCKECDEFFNEAGSEIVDGEEVKTCQHCGKIEPVAINEYKLKPMKFVDDGWEL